MSSRNGSSIRGSFCAARKMRLLGVARACSSARTELSRPTMKGAIIWGKTTMSRRGTRGRFSRFLLMNGEAILLSLRALACVPRRQPAFLYSMIGCTRLATTSSLITHCLMSRCEGTLYIRSSISSSRMMRRPRAPTLRLRASRALGGGAARGERGRRACAPAAGAGVALERFAGDGAQRLVGELELDPFELQDRLVLPDQAVLGLVENAHQRLLVELLERRDHGQAADELRDQTVLDQVLGKDLLEELVRLLVALALPFCPAATSA